MNRNVVSACAAGLFALAAPVQAVRVCEVNGASVNPSHGGTTAGKTGLMRCRDGEGGPIVREQELQNGVFMGIVRYYEKGALLKDYSVNERGNRDGRYREYAAKGPDGNTLLREETYRNGTTVGHQRIWHANGQLERVSFYNDGGQSQAAAEFTADGKLAALRCAERPLLAPHADDESWCGHRRNAPETVTLYGPNGNVRGKLTHERGERRGQESYSDNGKPRTQLESSAQEGTERTFSQEGVKRREIQWVTQGSGKESRRITTADREYHDSGTLVRERRYASTERGARLQLEQHWYLNGHPREKLASVTVEGRDGQREQRYHDNGQLSFDGVYLVTGRSGRQAAGVHQIFDSNGRLRGERHYDARGRVNRERELDDAGKVTRDDELYEDGSRKDYAQ